MICAVPVTRGSRECSASDMDFVCGCDPYCEFVGDLRIEIEMLTVDLHRSASTAYGFSIEMPGRLDEIRTNTSNQIGCISITSLVPVNIGFVFGIQLL